MAEHTMVLFWKKTGAVALSYFSFSLLTYLVLFSIFHSYIFLEACDNSVFSILRILQQTLGYRIR